MRHRTDYDTVELYCSQVLDSLLALLSISELVGALQNILANDDDEVVAHALISVHILMLLRFVFKFFTHSSNV